MSKPAACQRFGKISNSLVKITGCAFVVIDLTAKARSFFGRYLMALDIEDPFGRDSEAVRMEFGAVICLPDFTALEMGRIYGLDRVLIVLAHCGHTEVYRRGERDGRSA